jgi:uncharacterized Tic20 family protein
MTDNSDATPPSAPGEGSGFEPPVAPGSGSYEPPASGGYEPPPAAPAGGHNPPPAYGAPAGGAVPPGYGAGVSAADEKTWNMVSHFGGAGAAFVSGGFLGWVPPLISMLAKGNESQNVKANAVEALNFQLTWAIASVISYALMCLVIGFATIFVTIAVAVIFGIIAGVKSSNNEFYRYPVSVRIIK